SSSSASETELKLSIIVNREEPRRSRAQQFHGRQAYLLSESHLQAAGRRRKSSAARTRSCRFLPKERGRSRSSRRGADRSRKHGNAMRRCSGRSSGRVWSRIRRPSDIQSAPCTSPRRTRPPCPRTHLPTALHLGLHSRPVSSIRLPC